MHCFRFVAQTVSLCIMQVYFSLQKAKGGTADVSFGLPARHIQRDIAHCTWKYCWWNSNQYVLNVFFQGALKVYIVQVQIRQTRRTQSPASYSVTVTVNKQYRIPWSGVSCFSDLLKGIVYFYRGHPVVFYELWGLSFAIKYNNKFGY